MEKRETIHRKIFDSVELDQMLAFWRFRDLSVSMAYGTFDILKPGTIEMLIMAAEKGQVLLVAVKPDTIVQKHKGEGFPLNNQCDRAFTVASQMLVSGVHVVEVEDPLELVEKVKPVAIYCCDIEVNAFQKIEEWGGEFFKVDTDKAVERKSNGSCSCCE